MAGVVDMRSVIGGWSFLTSRGSYGVNVPNSMVCQRMRCTPLHKNMLTSFIIFMSIQLFEDVVMRWKSWGANGR